MSISSTLLYLGAIYTCLYGSDYNSKPSTHSYMTLIVTRSYIHMPIWLWIDTTFNNDWNFFLVLLILDCNDKNLLRWEPSKVLGCCCWINRCSIIVVSKQCSWFNSKDKMANCYTRRSKYPKCVYRRDFRDFFPHKNQLKVCIYY